MIWAPQNGNQTTQHIEGIRKQAKIGTGWREDCGYESKKRKREDWEKNGKKLSRLKMLYLRDKENCESQFKKGTRINKYVNNDKGMY